MAFVVGSSSTVLVNGVMLASPGNCSADRSLPKIRITSIVWPDHFSRTSLNAVSNARNRYELRLSNTLTYGRKWYQYVPNDGLS